MKEKRTYDNYKEHSNDMQYENEVRIENKMFLANTKMIAKIIESLIVIEKIPPNNKNQGMIVKKP